MIGKSFLVNGKFSLDLYRDFLSPAPYRKLLLFNSVTLAACTATASTLFGVPLGLLLGKTTIPLRGLLATILTTPLLIPPYILATAWHKILGSHGLLALWLGPESGVLTATWLFGLPGCVFVLSSAFAPIVMLFTIVQIRMIDPRLEEAGRLCTRWPATLRAITLPLMLSRLSLPIILVFVLALGEMTVPSLLRYPVLPVESFMQFAAFYNFGAATASAMPLLFICAIILYLDGLMVNDTDRPIRLRNNSVLMIDLQVWGVAAFIVVAGIVVLSVVAPFFALLADVDSPRLYIDAFVSARDSIVRSLAYATAGATVLTLVGFLCSYIVHLRLSPWSRGLDFILLFLFSLPSGVIAIGLITIWNTGATQWIYSTPVIVLFSYLAQYSALPSRLSQSALSNLPPNLIDAAKLAGVSWFSRTWYILLPLVKDALLLSWAASFIFCLRDVGLTLTLHPPGADTLPVWIFTFMPNAPPRLISALCVIAVVITLVPLGLFYRSLRRIQA
ncbi:MAG: iron ABC transporter permease [Gammaproteobacteria bacterium]|nr:iron ABC transporter permease [Gammaproteobacteria bacterium]